MFHPRDARWNILFSGDSFLTTFWHFEQRAYRAQYEKTKDKFTITSDDPRYQLARENRKMSQVNALVTLYHRPATSGLVAEEPWHGAWGCQQDCWWWPSHGIYRPPNSKKFFPFCISFLILSHTGCCWTATQTAAGMLSECSVVLHLLHQKWQFNH